MPHFVYAVRVGRTPGIYKTWDECAEQVKTFSGARYKKFKTIEEAQAFIDDTDVPKNVTGGSASNYQRKPAVAPPTPYTRPEKDGLLKPTDIQQNSKREFLTSRRHYTTETVAVVASQDNVASLTEEPAVEFSQEETAVVYTDGCCHNNGQEGAIAGIGVFWGVDSPLNIAEPLTGRATNNRAEIHAAVRAIAQAKELGKKKIVIYTDSQFLINSITQWVPKWMSNNWRLLSGKQVVNKDDFEDLLETMNDIVVEWIHVRGHQGVHGNEQADRLANEGARKHYSVCSF